MKKISQGFRMGMAAVCVAVLLPAAVGAQPPKSAAADRLVKGQLVQVMVNPQPDQPDAQRVQRDLSQLLSHYPPSLRQVLSIDPTLITNQAYLAPYPALVSFLTAHPEVVRDATYYVGGRFPSGFPPPQDRDRAQEMWNGVLSGIAVFAGFGMAIGLLVWLIRTVVDHRRWSRLTKTQTEVHTKLLDRMSTNEELLAYIQSPAGSRFLQSTPIALNPASRPEGAPLGRILLSVQGGVVLLAAGIGLQVVSWQGMARDAAPAIRVLGILAVALGIGFLVSAIISFVISHRLGLIETASKASGKESQSA